MSTESASSSEGIDRYEPRFLLWLWEKTRGEVGIPVGCAEFGAWQHIPADAVEAVVGRLGEHGLIRTHGSRADGPVVSFAAAGAEQAGWLQARRADPAERGRYARKAVLAWIFTQSDHNRPLRIEEFFDSREVFFLGEALLRAEVARAAAYLAEGGLIDCTGPLFHDRIGSHVSLTSLGVDAVLTGADVGRYVERQRELGRPTTGTVIHGSVYGPAHGDVTVQGDLTFQHALTAVELADLVRQFASVLADDEQSRGALLQSAEALRLQAGPGADPQPDQQRGLLERIRTALRASPDTVGKQMVLDAVGHAMARLLGQ